MKMKISIEIRWERSDEVISKFIDKSLDSFEHIVLRGNHDCDDYNNRIDTTLELAFATCLDFNKIILLNSDDHDFDIGFRFYRDLNGYCIEIGFIELDADLFNESDDSIFDISSHFFYLNEDQIKRYDSICEKLKKDMIEYPEFAYSCINVLSE